MKAVCWIGMRWRGRVRRITKRNREFWERKKKRDRKKRESE